MAYALNLPKLSFIGIGAVEEAINVLKEQPIKRALIVTEKNLVELGMLDNLIEFLDWASIDHEMFDDVTANPTVSLVERGLDKYVTNQCDCFIAVGGGSSIDCAKAIRIMASNEGHISDYNGVGKVKNDGDFFIAINTTAGTSAEMTSNSVITDEIMKVKMVIVDAKQIPNIAVNDPTMMLGLPSDVTAATGMDALTHAIEAYASKGANTVSRPLALEAIRLINQWLPVAVANGSDLEARTKMAEAQFLAGLSFNNAGLGLVHAMAHQPGATHDLPHGVCNAILLPVVSAFNGSKAPKAYRQVAEALGANTSELNDFEAAELAAARMKELANTVGIPSCLSELGVERKDLDAWIEKAMLDVCRGSNPADTSREDILNLYIEAL